MKRYDEALLNELYQYIMDYQRDSGESPSYRDILRNLPESFSSTAKIAGYIKVLKNRGLISTERNGSIAVDYRFRTEAVSVPLVGEVACGQPIMAIECIEGSYSLPTEIFGHGELMMLRAKGRSMINIGIGDGDLVVVKRQNIAEYGQIVLAMIDGDATIKTFYPDGECKIVLHPENETYDDIIVRDCEILGVVVGCIKTY